MLRTITTHTQFVWPCFKSLAEFLRSSRSNGHPASLQVGINHALIFYAACYIEGVLETGLKALVRRRPDAAERDLDKEVARTIGKIQNYDDLFHQVASQRISDGASVKAIWKGLVVLFQFRNVLAHAREITAVSTWEDGAPKSWDWWGGYKEAEQYLLIVGGGKGVRTPDLLDAIQTLSQLSYTPTRDAASGSETLPAAGGGVKPGRGAAPAMRAARKLSRTARESSRGLKPTSSLRRRFEMSMG